MFGGLLLGVLSALPLINLGNVCCCLWILSGGAVAAYLLQANQPNPITPGDGATVGLMAGVIGSVVELVVSIPVSLAMGPLQGRFMERLLEKAIEYARTRQQFGKPIGKYQAISHRIADMKVRLEAARLLVYRAAWRLGRSRTVGLDASMAKLFVSESLVEGALGTGQVLGGYGFMTAYQAERALRDAIGSTIYSGTSEMQRNSIASWLGL